MLLACAYAPRDNLGTFRPGDLRAPLSAIVHKDMDYPRFQRHLTELSGESRQTLHKEGEARHYVYRFRNPLLQPFVKMVGRAKKLIADELGEELQRKQIENSAPDLLDPI